MKPHKWAKEIKAWADGAEIEQRYIGSATTTYRNCTDWHPTTNINWDMQSWEYRIKPQPKEPQYLYVYHQEGKGLEIGYAPHEALNMWKTKIIGKIKLEQDE